MNALQLRHYKCPTWARPGKIAMTFAPRRLCEKRPR
jgi:hypothetical protein